MLFSTILLFYIGWADLFIRKASRRSAGLVCFSLSIQKDFERFRA